MSKKIKVLIVDDSAVIRNMLTAFLSSDPDLEVVGTAPDPYVARDKLVQLKPDVITLDVEMPKMDGITFLRKMMQFMPTRTIVISSLTTAGAAASLAALEAGAIDIMAKPALDVKASMETIRAEIIQRVKVCAQARLPTISAGQPVGSKTVTKADYSGLERTTDRIIAIASSTGGTEALKQVLPFLPPDTPGMVIAQHMPAGFTKTFADSLNQMCQIDVKEAQEGDRVVSGLALIAPGNFHMELIRKGAYYFVRLHQEPPMHGVRPAADYLMKSVAKYAGANAFGAVLTGMGKDGAEGLKVMRDAGAKTVAQDEKSCIVFGMPKVAIEMGGAEQVLALEKIHVAMTAWALATQIKKSA